MKARLGTPWLLFALVLPVVGLVGLVIRAEYAVRSGPVFRLMIRGYDPRDLLRGHYLTYEYELNWSGGDTCGRSWGSAPTEASEGGRASALSADCCLCLSRAGASGVNPLARQVSCDDPRGSCDGWLRAESLMPPQRYFVPEESAAKLESALRARKASLELVVKPDGTPAVRDLYLDGLQWRTTLE